MNQVLRSKTPATDPTRPPEPSAEGSRPPEASGVRVGPQAEASTLRRAPEDGSGVREGSGPVDLWPEALPR
jgi:hypothetical protein